MPIRPPPVLGNVVLAPDMPPTWHILLAGGACIALVPLMSAQQVQLGFGLCGAILLLLGLGIGALRKWAHFQTRQQRGTAEHMIAHDSVAGFITDRSGKLYACNRAAKDRFGTVTGQVLSDVFADVLANPSGIFTQLLMKARGNGAATEDILTRSGHYRMRVVLMGDDCHLWWLDDLSAGVSKAKSDQDATLPKAVISPEGRILRRNAAFRSLVGDDLQDIELLLGKLPLRSGQVHKFTTHETEGHYTVAPVVLEHGDIALYLLAAEDPSASTPQLEAGWDEIEDLPVPLLRIGKDGALLGSNREARSLLNIEKDGAYRLSDVLDGPGRHINEWLSEAMNGNGAQVSQFLRGRGEKAETFVQVTLSTSGTDDDRHLIAVLNDVTELKALEAQFVQSQKMQAIGQLAGGVAHDFNNLLTAISGHCDLLLLRHDEGDQNYGDLIQIHQNANRAASLVGQLLAFSRKQNLHLEPIDLRHTLSDLTHLLNRLVGEKVTLTLDHDSDLARIKADKRQLEQVLMNLVVNARDAMDGAGEIEVVTENLVLDSEMCKDRAVVPAGAYVSVKVIDHGHGIAPEELTKIFEPFWTTKRLGEGTGLGLSTAYGIVKQTGGYIFVESSVGEGSTFSMLFPVFDATAVATPVTPKSGQRHVAHQSDGVILLVEDEAPVRAFASRALQLKGYTVLEADCAEAALTMLEDPDLKIDLFVTDVIMPGMDGPTWVRQARIDRPSVKVIFVSGYPEDAFDDGEAQIADAVFLPKPFSLTALTQTVGEQLAVELVAAE